MPVDPSSLVTFNDPRAQRIVQGFFAQEDPSGPGAFSEVCTFIHEQTGLKTTGQPPTQWQRVAMLAWEKKLRIIINKPRQAMASEACLRTTLKHCMYRAGLVGLLVANKDDTAEKLFKRLNDCYEGVDPSIRVPLLQAGKTRGSSNKIDFIHGGSITVVSMQEGVPSVGGSPGLVWYTEFGKSPKHRQVETKRSIGGSYAKKKWAMIAFESTPGRLGDEYYRMWINALKGPPHSSYYPIFFDWVKDPNYRKEPPPRWQPNAVELELMEKYGATLEHAFFIHDYFMGEGAENWDLTWNMYPRSVDDGWETDAAYSGLPKGILTPQLDIAKEDSSLPTADSGLHEVRRIKKGEEVIIVCDPAGFAEDGDPTGIKAFSDSADEVATWDGVITPIQAADKIMLAAEYYYRITGRKTIVAIEANKSDVITLLRDRQNSNPAACFFKLYNDKESNAGGSSTGWYSTERKKQRAEQRLAANVRAGKMHLTTRVAIAQLMSYDRSKSWQRVKGANGQKHHYDLAICALIAADVMVTFGWMAEAEPVAETSPISLDENLSPKEKFMGQLIARIQQDTVVKRPSRLPVHRGLVRGRSR